MSYKFKGENGYVTGVEFSDDHQFQSFIWLVRDGVSCSLADYFDKDRMHSLKLNADDRCRVRAMTAVHLAPRRRAEKFGCYERMMWWGGSALDTIEEMDAIMDLRVTHGNNDISPDRKKWFALFAQHGSEPLFDVSSIRSHFPEMYKEEGARFAKTIMDHAAYLQQAKQRHSCDRGRYPDYESGQNGLYIAMEPLISAAIEHLTGALPERPLGPAEAFHLEFEGSKLVAVRQKWIDVKTGSEEVFKA
jgi:hypothetical protein